MNSINVYPNKNIVISIMDKMRKLNVTSDSNTEITIRDDEKVIAVNTKTNSYRNVTDDINKCIDAYGYPKPNIVGFLFKNENCIYFKYRDNSKIKDNHLKFQSMIHLNDVFIPYNTYKCIESNKSYNPNIPLNQQYNPYNPDSDTVYRMYNIVSNYAVFIEFTSNCNNSVVFTLCDYNYNTVTSFVITNMIVSTDNSSNLKYDEKLSIDDIFALGYELFSMHGHDLNKCTIAKMSTRFEYPTNMVVVNKAISNCIHNHFRFCGKTVNIDNNNLITITHKATGNVLMINGNLYLDKLETIVDSFLSYDITNDNVNEIEDTLTDIYGNLNFLIFVNPCLDIYNSQKLEIETVLTIVNDEIEASYYILKSGKSIYNEPIDEIDLLIEYSNKINDSYIIEYIDDEYLITINNDDETTYTMKNYDNDSMIELLKEINGKDVEYVTNHLNTL